MSELCPTLLFQMILGSFIMNTFRKENLRSFMERATYLRSLPVKMASGSCFPRPFPVAFRLYAPIGPVGLILQNCQDYRGSFAPFRPMTRRHCVKRLRKHLPMRLERLALPRSRKLNEKCLVGATTPREI